MSIKQVSEALSLNPYKSIPQSPTIISGKGCWLYDNQGRKFFDCSGGSGAISLGHQNERVMNKAIEQVQKLIHTGWNIQTDVRNELIQKLGNFSPFSECAVLLTLPGCEGIEAALKIARAYTGRKSIVNFERAFHGKSSGALSVTWRESFKKYAVLPEEYIFTAPYPLNHLNEHDEERCLSELKKIIKEACETGMAPAAIILEPIQTSEGVLAAGENFLKGVKKIAKEAGSLVIFDEIYTGVCRTGTNFYASRDGIRPDLLVVGKGLANGFPISAVIGRPEVVNALPLGGHSSTFAGNPLACAVASTVLDVIEEMKLSDKVSQVGNELKSCLEEFQNKIPFMANVRGEGLLLGFDCVDKNKTPDPELAKRFCTIAYENGMILRYGGFNNATIKITPPLIMEYDELEFLKETLYRNFNRMW